MISVKVRLSKSMGSIARLWKRDLTRCRRSWPVHLRVSRSVMAPVNGGFCHFSVMVVIFLSGRLPDGQWRRQSELRMDFEAYYENSERLGWRISDLDWDALGREAAAGLVSDF